MDIKKRVAEVNKEVDVNIKQMDKGSNNAKKVSSLLKVLKEKISNFKNSEEFKNLLKTYSKFHNYSINNKQLIFLQTLGQATKVAGYKTWKDLGRNVKKGEKGIKILAPSYYYKKVYKRDEKGNILKDDNDKPIMEKKKVNYFIAVSVFDISQTEGKPLPKLDMEINDDLSFMEKPLLKYAKDKNIKVEFMLKDEDLVLNDSCHGYSEGGRVVVKEDLNKAEQMGVLVHELAHESLHKDKDRLLLSKEQKECEADAVKFVVLDRYGVNSKSEKYLSLYQKDYDLLDSLGRIGDTSRSIINEIENYRGLVREEIELNGAEDTIKKLEANIVKVNKKLLDLPEGSEEHKELFSHKKELAEALNTFEKENPHKKLKLLKKKMKPYEVHSVSKEKQKAR